METQKVNRRDIDRFHTAMLVARNSQCRFKMGAAIYRNRKPLSVGMNVIKTHTEHNKRYGKHVISIHAEHMAVLKAQCTITGATLYIARDGGITSKPCQACYTYMRECGIACVVYMLNGKLIKEWL